MSLTESFSNWLAGPPLTKGRIWFAFSVAVATDAIQIALGPFGWILLDDFLDVIAMILTSASLGFHMLLLPTFMLELVPVADMFPTWTGCTAAVVMLRRRAQRPPEPPPIEVFTEVTRVPPSEPRGGKS
jgi:hypothetical protein